MKTVSARLTMMRFTPSAYEIDVTCQITDDGVGLDVPLACILFDWFPDDGQDEANVYINIPRVTMTRFDSTNEFGLRDLDVLRAVLDAIVDSNAYRTWSDSFEALCSTKAIVIQLPVRRAHR